MALILSICLLIGLLSSSTSIKAEDVSLEKALKGPDWVYEGVVYCVFPRDFSSDGNLKSVTEKLEEISNLGATIVWLMPLHPIGEKMRKGSLGSPYSIKDYYAINPDYGTKEDLKKLVNRAHELGLKVIIDAVINHTSWDNALIKNPKFYKQDAQNRIIAPLPDWHDVAALDFNNPSVRSYMIDMLKYWLITFNLDGFRFDAASFVPLDFWEEARSALKAVKSDILLLGEEDIPEDLVKAFDLDYDWHLEEKLNEVINNGAPATETLQGVLSEEESTFPKGGKHLRFLDNHDQKRAIVRFGEKGALTAAAFIFTLEGVPLVYNGMEVGDTTESRDPALFEKMPIFWGSKEIRPEFVFFYKKMISLRKEHPALISGQMSWVSNSDEPRIVTYLRSNEEEQFLIAINFSNQPFSGSVDIDPDKKYTDLTPVKDPLTAMDLPKLSLQAFEFRIFQVE